MTTAIFIWLKWPNCLTGPYIAVLLCNCCSGTRFALCNDPGWLFPVEQALKSLFEPCASEIVHKEIHRETHIRTYFTNSHENTEGICKPSPSSQSRLKHRNNSKDYHGNGKHEELDGQSDEHFGDADLFAGQTGRRLAAPTNDMGQSDRRDDGRYQYDDWKTDCQTKPVKHTIQSAENGLIPKVVTVDVQLPGKPLRAHLIETRDLIHGSDGEPRKHKNRHADNNYEGKSFCRNASLSSQGKQDTDTSFSWDDHRQEHGAID